MKHNMPAIDPAEPQVMAILNVTPDSFYAGSRTPDGDAVARRVREALDEGASIIDVGGYSSRPGADEVSPDEEWRRVRLGLAAVRQADPDVAVSVDTFRSGVVRRAVAEFGPVIVNDISAGELDPDMLRTVAELDLPYIAMHMKGDPKTMQSLTDYRRWSVTSARASATWSVPASAAGGSSSTRASASPRPPRRTSNCLPDCTASARWAVRCWRAFRASR